MKKFLSIIIGLTLSIGFVQSAKASIEQYKEKVGFDDHYIEAYDLEQSNGNDRLMAKRIADIERASKPTVHYDETVRSHYMCDWQYNKVLGRWACGKDYQKAYAYTNPQPIPVCSYGYNLNYTKTGCVRIQVPENGLLNARGDGWQCLPGFHVNNSGTTCLSNKEHIYTQCPGGVGTCNTPTSYKAPCTTTTYKRPITKPQNIMVTPTGYTVTTVNYNYSDTYSRYDEANTHYVYVYPQHETPVQLAQTGPGAMWIIVLGLLGFIIVGLKQISIK